MALRSAITTAANLELTKLKVFSDNQTLIRAISSDIQSTEIYGIVLDILQIAYVFIAISFYHFRHDKNV